MKKYCLVYGLSHRFSPLDVFSNRCLEVVRNRISRYMDMNDVMSYSESTDGVDVEDPM